MRTSPIQTSCNDQAEQCLARAWTLLDRGEHLARQGGGDESGPGLWLLAANSILRARDALEAIHPAAPHGSGLDAPVGQTCSDLVRAAAQQLAGIPAGHEPAGLSLALVHLAQAGHEVEGRSCS